MQKVNLEFFYALGTQLSPLAKLNAQQTNRIAFYLVAEPARQITTSLLQTLPLQTCVQSGLAVIAAINDWINEQDFAKQTSDLTPAEKYRISLIAGQAAQFETVLLNELQPLHSYLVEKRAGYGADTLVGAMDEVLEDVRSRLDQSVLDNVLEAGKCLAFENATAAGFHILRATEAVMYSYYLGVFNPENRVALSNWQRYIDKFNSSDHADVKRVAALAELIKEEDRDRIIHPERELLEPKEARRLFDACKTLIMAMADRLPEQANGETTTQDGAP